MFETKVPYPQVLQRLLAALRLPVTLNGMQTAAKIIKSREVVNTRHENGYVDEDQIIKIEQKVVGKYPALKELVQDFIDEGCGYSTLCRWLNDFLEDTDFLAGNRPWIIDDIIPVKCASNKFDFGVMIVGVSGYTIYEHKAGSDIPFIPGQSVIATYKTAFEAALDGWKVD